jgi:hypothetical protein
VELMTMQTKRSLPTSAVALIATVIAAGAASVALRLPELGGWRTGDLLGLAAIALLTAIGEKFSVNFRFGDQTKHVTVTEASFAAALLLGVRPSVLTLGVVAGVIASNVMRGTALHKAAFNVGSFATAITVSEILFRAALPAGALVAIVPAMAAFFAINAGTVVGVIAAVEGRSFASVFGSISRVELTHFAGNLAAGIVAASVLSASAATAPVAVLVGALCYGSYRWVAGHTRTGLLPAV